MSRLDLPPAVLVGRDRERGFLQEFFQEAAVSGGAVLLFGEPGAGKTALLNGPGDLPRLSARRAPVSRAPGEAPATPALPGRRSMRTSSFGRSDGVVRLLRWCLR